MPESFDPGPGWDDVTDTIEWESAELVQCEPDGGEPIRWWNPSDRRPPLPTEPFTVILVTPGDDVWLRTFGGGWAAVGLTNIRGPLDPARVTSFEILSEPRAVTAKAVLDRVREERPDLTGTMRVVEELAREFGVTE